MASDEKNADLREHYEKIIGEEIKKNKKDLMYATILMVFVSILCAYCIGVALGKGSFALFILQSFFLYNLFLSYSGYKKTTDNVIKSTKELYTYHYNYRLIYCMEKKSCSTCKTYYARSIEDFSYCIGCKKE